MSRVSFQILVVLGVCFAVGLNAGLIRSTRALCPTVTTKSDFDYLQYPGVWYEIQKIPVVFEEGLLCIRAIYDKIGENRISVLNTGMRANGDLTLINGTAYQPDPVNQPGNLTVSFPGRPDGTYLVLDTDYTSYSSVYDCAQAGAVALEYAWVLGRSNRMDSATLTKALAAYTKFGINVTKFENTVHDASCVYAP